MHLLWLFLLLSLNNLFQYSKKRQYHTLFPGISINVLDSRCSLDMIFSRLGIDYADQVTATKLLEIAVKSYEWKYSKRANKSSLRAELNEMNNKQNWERWR